MIQTTIEMLRGAGKKVWETWKVGDRVQHIGTKEWAIIEQIVPQPDGTCEMVLKREAHPLYNAPRSDLDRKAYWASYHIADHKAAP